MTERYIPLLLLTLIALYGCAPDHRASSDNDAPTDDSPAATDHDTILTDTEESPDEGPISSALEKALQYSLDEYHIFSGEPGTTMALLIPGAVKWEGATGVTDRDKNTPMTPDILFGTGSNTKPFVAVTVLQLSEEKKLSLDDTLADLFPEYPAWGRVTIRQLLHMRSGIHDYIFVPELQLEALMNPMKKWTPAELLGYVADKEFDFDPDEGCAYSNSNFILLGLLIERVTGNKASSEIRRRIIDPLGLTCTAFHGEEELPGTISEGYADVFGNFYHISAMLDPSFVWTAGAIVSCSRDLAEFARGLFFGDLVKPATMIQMKDFTNCSLLDGEVDYGLGLMRRETPAGTSYGHGGTSYGYGSFLFYIPEHDIITAYLTNYVPDQARFISDDSLRIVATNDLTAYPPCEPPADLLTPPAGPTLTVSVKGLINETISENSRKAAAYTIYHADGNATKVYRLSRIVSREVVPGASDAIVINTVGEIDDQTGTFLQATVNIDRGLLNYLRDEGLTHFRATDTTHLNGYVSRTTVDPQTNEPAKICFFSVADLTAGTDLYLCHEQNREFLPGETVRFHLSIPMTEDPEAVTAFMEQAGHTELCFCRDEEGLWHDCAENN